MPRQLHIVQSSVFKNVLLPILFIALLISGCRWLPDWFAQPTPEPFFEAACAFQWATQPLPEISAQLAAALVQAKVDGATISASAYGENCINPDSSVRSFSAMETDYALTVPADQLASALAVLVGEAADGHAGANPGRIALAIGSSNDVVRLQVPFKTAADAVAQGLEGVALLTALNGP